jgi:Transcriptional repressor of class III stress genes
LKISDAIAKIIEDMLNNSDGTLEIQRNDFANKFGCVPSQINYVITSRFTPERGYIIESRRGGGGYIRIIKKEIYKNEYLMHFFYAIGDELDENSAVVFMNNLYANDIITVRERNIMKIMFQAVKNNNERADIMRQIILAVME